MNIIIEKTVNYLKNLINRIIIDDFMGMAAEMGFWFAIGIFPFMLFMMSFFSTFDLLKNQITRQKHTLSA